MIDKHKVAQICTNLFTDQQNYMDSLWHNLNTIMDYAQITTQELSDASGVPIGTINSILYGKKRSDSNLSTILKLSRALGISIDELVGCNTLSTGERTALAKCRNLSERSRYLIDWFISFQYDRVRIEKETHKRIITIMIPEFIGGTDLYPTMEFDTLDISDYPANIKSKVFLGIKLQTDVYMPTYTPYDILLLANDRPPRDSEKVVIKYRDKLYIARKIQLDDQAAFLSIRDGYFKIKETEIDSYMGYIAAIHEVHL